MNFQEFEDKVKERIQEYLQKAGIENGSRITKTVDTDQNINAFRLLDCFSANSLTAFAQTELRSNRYAHKTGCNRLKECAYAWRGGGFLLCWLHYIQKTCNHY